MSKPWGRTLMSAMWAATPNGFAVTVKVKLVEVDRRRLVFEIEAHDDVDLISRGRHERFVINKAAFDLKLKEKNTKAGN